MLASAEAEYGRCDYVGTEHLLCGLLREQGGVAYQLLEEAGVTLQAIRGRLVELGLAKPVPVLPEGWEWAAA